MLLVAALSLVPALACWIAASCDWFPLPTGSAGVGFWFGVAGAGIIVFEMLLPARKRLWARTSRELLFLPLGRIRHWMTLHIWVGLLAVPLAIVHSGFKFAGPGSVSGWTMITFLVVSASGVWGLALQQVLPRRIFDEVADETIAAEIETVTERDIADAEQMLRKLAEETVIAGQERCARSRLAALSGHRAPTSDIFDREIKPYLLMWVGLRWTPLRSIAGAQNFFSQLHRELPEHAYETVRRLERMCDVRRQRDRQRQLDGWLFGWLLVHIPLAVVLLLLLVWHVVTALKLW